MQHQSGAAGAPTVGGRMVSQALYFFPTFAAVPAREQSCWFGSGIERAVGVAKRPDLRELICKRQWLLGPVHHCCELRIVGRPVIDLPFCELCDLPGFAQVRGAPHARAMELAAPAGP